MDLEDSSMTSLGTCSTKQDYWDSQITAQSKTRNSSFSLCSRYGLVLDFNQCSYPANSVTLRCGTGPWFLGVTAAQSVFECFHMIHRIICVRQISSLFMKKVSRCSNFHSPHQSALVPTNSFCWLLMFLSVLSNALLWCHLVINKDYLQSKVKIVFSLITCLLFYCGCYSGIILKERKYVYNLTFSKMQCICQNAFIWWYFVQF